MAGSQIVVSSGIRRNFVMSRFGAGSVTTPPSKTGLMLLLLMSLRYIRCMSIDSWSGRHTTSAGSSQSLLLHQLADDGFDRFGRLRDMRDAIIRYGIAVIHWAFMTGRLSRYEWDIRRREKSWDL